MNTMSFLNFDLAISKSSNDYQVIVFNSPAGQATKGFVLPQSIAQLHRLPFSLDTKSNSSLKSAWGELYQAIFHSDIDICLKRSIDIAEREGKGIRIRLHLSEVPELSIIPWEYLYDVSNDRFFSLSNKTPIIRYLNLPQVEQSLNVTLPLKILVMISSPTDLISLETELEWQNILNSLENLIERDLVSVTRVEQPTFSSLQTCLRQGKYHIFHFVGHGWSEPDQGLYGLFFEDNNGLARSITSDDLGILIHDHSSLRLAFLNMCQGASHAVDNLFSGTAQNLVLHGLPAVLAMQSTISDKSAVVMSREFYLSLADGYSVDAALSEARKAIFDASEGFEWGIPVLFCRSSDTHLFNLTDEEQINSCDIFLVSPKTLDAITKTYTIPNCEPSIVSIIDFLIKNRCLLITGETGIGKRWTAQYIASQILKRGLASKVLMLFRSTPFDEVVHSDGAVIIIPDAFGVFEWERTAIEQEFSLLNRIAATNFVILTSDERVIEEVTRETRIEGWEQFRKNQLNLNSDSYTLEMREQILYNHIHWLNSNGDIDQRQQEWFINPNDVSWPAILKSSLKLWCTPFDIRRFLIEQLPKIKTKKQLILSLQKLASVDDEIFLWFNNLHADLRLTDDLQCFLFVLAIFDGFERPQLWDWYRQIVMQLQQLNRTLEVRPLGVMVNLLSPYITIYNQTPMFAHPSFQQALLKSISISYREYFIELSEFFRDAIVPITNNEISISDFLVHKTQQQRTAITIATATIAQYGVDDVWAIVEALADTRIGKIQSSAVDIIVSAIKNSTQKNKILEVLHTWAYNRSDEFIGRRWTVAVTLGRLTQSPSRRSIKLLENLANDRSKFVRAVIPSSLRGFVGSYPEACSRIYTKLAADSDAFTRRSVSTTLRGVAFNEQSFVIALLQGWSELHSLNRRWTLVRTTILLATLRTSPEYSDLLLHYIEYDLKTTQKTLADALKFNDITPNEAWKLLKSLIEYSVNHSTKLATLASLIESKFPDYSWNEIGKWSHEIKSRFRLAAANILAHWKDKYPEKTQSLLSILSSDPDSEVAYTAQLDPLIVIPTSFFADMTMEQKEDEKEYLNFEQFLG